MSYLDIDIDVLQSDFSARQLAAAWPLFFPLPYISLSGIFPLKCLSFLSWKELLLCTGNCPPNLHPRTSHRSSAELCAVQVAAPSSLEGSWWPSLVTDSFFSISLLIQEDFQVIFPKGIILVEKICSVTFHQSSKYEDRWLGDGRTREGVKEKVGMELDLDTKVDLMGGDENRGPLQTIF